MAFFVLTAPSQNLRPSFVIASHQVVPTIRAGPMKPSSFNTNCTEEASNSTDAVYVPFLASSKLICVSSFAIQCPFIHIGAAPHDPLSGARERQGQPKRLPTLLHDGLVVELPRHGLARYQIDAPLEVSGGTSRPFQQLTPAGTRPALATLPMKFP